MTASPVGGQLPRTQYAVQLVGPSQLTLNREKPVHQPGPHQIVAKIEAVGLCFSDLKLLKQFTEHARKGEVVRGIEPRLLDEIPSYVPGTNPTVPGHEGVCRIVAVGEKVTRHKVGERCLIQTDYRWLRTAAGSNAAFGYNFEGALQEYVLMDERMIIEPGSGERFLIPVGENLGASAVALVEPWACVEDSYVSPERRTIKAAGRLLVVADAGRRIQGLAESFAAEGKPASVTCACAEPQQRQAVEALGIPKAEETEFDDIVYFGSDKATIESLNDKLAPNGIINIVLAGHKIGQPVMVGVGRVHYGMTRWIGTTGASAATSYESIPATGELRPGEKAIVVGAGGPMGQMHVIRDVCAGVPDLTLVATDFDEERLESLRRKAQPLADANRATLRMVNPQKQKLDETFTYFALMAPVPALVADAIRSSADRCLINIFAGIPAPVKHELDLDAYIANRCFMFGTSGSVIRDMKIVLEKMEQGRLDTDCSVDAISGMAGAADGIAAVENRTLAGKIIVYPMLHDVPLIPLAKLDERFPSVAAKLENGQWTAAAEAQLLKTAGA